MSDDYQIDIPPSFFAVYTDARQRMSEPIAGARALRSLRGPFQPSGAARADPASRGGARGRRSPADPRGTGIADAGVWQPKRNGSCAGWPSCSAGPCPPPTTNPPPERAQVAALRLRASHRCARPAAGPHSCGGKGGSARLAVRFASAHSMPRPRSTTRHLAAARPGRAAEGHRAHRLLHGPIDQVHGGHLLGTRKAFCFMPSRRSAST
jgi:hypothetical protein